jgi:hypothetical protein
MPVYNVFPSSSVAYPNRCPNFQYLSQFIELSGKKTVEFTVPLHSVEMDTNPDPAPGPDWQAWMPIPMRIRQIDADLYGFRVQPYPDSDKVFVLLKIQNSQNSYLHCSSGMFIPDPDFIHPGSRNQQQQQKRRGKNFVATNMTKLKKKCVNRDIKKLTNSQKI